LRPGRLLLAVCGAAALAAASGVLVVALCLALFAVLEPVIGPAGAAAAVAAACLVVLASAGLTLMFLSLGRSRRAPAPEPGDLGASLMDLAGRRPLMAMFGAAAIAALGVAALRNPRTASGLISLVLGLRRPR
jgi:hypothetical protein